MKNIVYGLKDPRNDVYYYIGKSTVGVDRPLMHLTESHSEKVREWIALLQKNWLYPQIDIIEEVENLEDLANREKYWINYYYDLNPNLLNIDLIPHNILDIRNEKDEEIFNMFQQKIFNIPEILRNERIYRKLTQNEMAKHMGVNRSTVSLIENGGNVTLKNVQKYFLTLKGFDIISKQKNQRVRHKNY
jgi:DNA-binding XRE family transcriptional regulator